MLLLQQIALYKTNEEIEAWAKKNLERPIKAPAITYHRANPDNQPLIKKLREEFNMKIMDVEWSSKRRRLEEMGKIYLESRSEGKNSVALKCLAEMREEIEGKKGQGNTVNLIQNNYTSMTDEEIDKKRLELVELVQRHKIIEATSTEISQDSSVISDDSENV